METNWGFGVLGPLHDVTLVCDERNDNVFITVLTQALQPEAEVLKRVLVRNIIYKERAHRTTIMTCSDRAVLLASARVPDLSFHSHRVLERDDLGRELNADRGHRFFESVVHVAQQNVALADPAVAREDNLVQLVVALCVRYARRRLVHFFFLLFCFRIP